MYERLKSEGSFFSSSSRKSSHTLSNWSNKIMKKRHLFAWITVQALLNLDWDSIYLTDVQFYFVPMLISSNIAALVCTKVADSHCKFGADFMKINIYISLQTLPTHYFYTSVHQNKSEGGAGGVTMFWGCPFIRLSHFLIAIYKERRTVSLGLQWSFINIDGPVLVNGHAMY